MTVFRKFREQVGWTQVQLARALGTSKQRVSFWETGQRAVPTDDAHRFLVVAREQGFPASLEDVYPPP